MTAAGNLEFRFNILPVRYFSLGSIPLAGPYLVNMRFSIEGVLFLDAGYARYSEEGEVVDNEMYAWGGGVQFQLPYVQVAHVLVGWSPEQKLGDPSTTVGIGVTF